MALRGDAIRFARLVRTTGRNLASPPSGTGWAVPLGVAIAAYLAWLWKRPIETAFQGRGGPVGAAASLAAFGNVAGAGVTMLALGLGALVAGRASRRNALAEAALVIGAAGVWCWLLLRIGQFVFAEQRPLEGGAMRWLGLDGHGVSGHAAAAALLIAPLRDVLARDARPAVRKGVGALAIAWALFIGGTRMWLGMHFLWNVLLGLALGLATGRAAVAGWRELGPGERNST